MARDINEIKKTMTDEYMSNPVIREQYGFPAGATWEMYFGTVAIENILFYVVAACCHVLEVMLEAYLTSVEEKIDSSVVASVPWYHQMALRFQWGDALVFNDAIQQYVYPEIHPDRQVVKYVSVQDRGSSVQILVSGEKDGLPVPLSEEVLMTFKTYMNRVKIAGIVLSVRSLPADRINVAAIVTVDPLVISENGIRITDGSKPVENAIVEYLRSIVYGGTFNKTRLVDAIQAVEGVTDVELGICQYSSSGNTEFKTITGNNYTAVGGSFIASGLKNSLIYVAKD